MIRKFINWLHSLFMMYIIVNKETSDVYLSKALFSRIQQDHPDDKHFRVLFSRTASSSIFSSSSNCTDYIMFFNPEWDKHGVSNPNMILTSPIIIGKHSHVGFQAVQPTAEELLAVYGSQEPVQKLYVSREKINGEPYYRVLRP